MKITFQDHYALNSVSTIYTLVIYLMLKSSAWVIQWNVLVILSCSFICLLYHFDMSHFCSS